MSTELASPRPRRPCTAEPAPCPAAWRHARPRDQRGLRDRLARDPAGGQEPALARLHGHLPDPVHRRSSAAASARTSATRCRSPTCRSCSSAWSPTRCTRARSPGMTNLVEERENDFTAELFVAPISRYAVLLGKLIGSGIAALVSLVGIVAMIFVMQIPMNFGRPAAGHRAHPDPRPRRRRARRLHRRHHPGPQGVAIERAAADLPADVPVRGAHPGRGLDGHPGLPRPDHPDDLRDRPGPEHLLLGQARVRGGRAPSARRGPRGDVGFFLVFTIVGTFLFVRADRNR